jgi:hypothetical protein
MRILRSLNVPSALAALLVATIASAVFTMTAEAQSRNNRSQAEVSRTCSAQAERYAERNFRRTTAGGALLGAGVGSAVGRNRNVSRNATRGALIGGGAGMMRSNSQWMALYNRAYRNCMDRKWSW